MTVSTTTSQVTYIGNGSTTVFSFSFIGVTDSDIEVIYTDSNGVEHILDASQYTISLNSAAPGELWGIGGTVTYPISGSAITTGTQLTIKRIIPYTQNTSISNQGAFYPTAVEQALDMIVLELQQINTNLGYAISTPVVDSSTPTILPVAAERANLYLGFDDTGQPTVLPGTVEAGGGVISVGLSMPGDFTVANSPITGSGTLTVTRENQNAHAFLGGPTSGSPSTPSYRTLVSSDLPVGSDSQIGGVQVDGSTITSINGVISAATLNATPTVHTVSGTTTINLSSSDAYKGISLYMSGSAVVTVQLPNNFSGPFPIYDGSGNSSTFPITVLPPAGLTIRGSSSYVINTNYGSAIFQTDSSSVLVIKSA